MPPHDDGFPRVELPYQPRRELGDELYADGPVGLAKLRGERDAAYKTINALVRKYAGGITAHLDPAEIAREEPVITVEYRTVMEGFTIRIRPLR